MGDAGNQLELPPYWLVHALTWPARIDQWSLARAALVWAPALEEALPRAARDVRYVAQAYHQHYGGSVVFFSDLDAFLEREDTSWRERRTEPRAALDQLLHGDLAVPGLLLLISRYAHRILGLSPHTPALDTRDADATRDAAWQREAVRQAIALQLAVDWPAHIRCLIDEGRLTPPASPASVGDRVSREPSSGSVGHSVLPPPD